MQPRKPALGRLSMYMGPAGVGLVAALLFLGQRAAGASKAEDPFYWTAFIGLPIFHAVALAIGIAALVRGEPRLWAWTGIGLNALVLAVFAGFLWLVARVAALG